ESDPVHIENFTLHPVGPSPDVHGRGEPGIGIIDTDLDDDAVGGLMIEQDVMNLEPVILRGSFRVAEIINSTQFGEEKKTGFVLQVRENLDERGLVDMHPDVVPE